MATRKTSAPQPQPQPQPTTFSYSIAELERMSARYRPDLNTMVWLDWGEPRPMPPHLAPLSTPKKPRPRLPKYIRKMIERELPERSECFDPPEQDNGVLRFGPMLVEPAPGLAGLALFPRGSLSKLTRDDLRWLLAVEFERLMRVERNEDEQMSAFEQEARREAHYERIGQLYQKLARLAGTIHAPYIVMNELCAFWNGGSVLVKRYPQPLSPTLFPQE
jgi:hypothetical protein